MTLLYLDSFEYYSDANMTEGLYVEKTGTYIGGTAYAAARTGTQQLSGNAAANNRLAFATKSRIGVGFACWRKQLDTDSATFLELKLGTLPQMHLDIDSVGRLTVIRGVSLASSVLGTTANPVFFPGVWNHVECWATIHPSAGEVEVRINEVMVIHLTGVDTTYNGLAGVDNVSLQNNGTSISSNYYFDDYYIADSLGTDNNTFIGDYKVFTLLPNGDTADADWTPNTGAGYAALDEVIVTDDDTTYVEAVSAGDVSIYDMQDLDPAYTDIRGVMTVVRSKKTDAGTANMTPSIVSGATTEAGADRGLTISYCYYPDMHQHDPNTGARWTRAAVNAAKLKIERTA